MDRTKPGAGQLSQWATGQSQGSSSPVSGHQSPVSGQHPNTAPSSFAPPHMQAGYGQAPPPPANYYGHPPAAHPVMGNRLAAHPVMVNRRRTMGNRPRITGNLLLGHLVMANRLAEPRVTGNRLRITGNRQMLHPPTVSLARLRTAKRIMGRACKLGINRPWSISRRLQQNGVGVIRSRSVSCTAQFRLELLPWLLATHFITPANNCRPRWLQAQQRRHFGQVCGPGRVAMRLAADAADAGGAADTAEIGFAAAQEMTGPVCFI